MSYRVEVATTGRAGCTNKECKDAKLKIDKGTLRLGTWVEIPNVGGGWKWKHWGCVTGSQIEHMRSSLAGDADGEYNWDLMDGYEGEDKGCLQAYPEMQEKVRRVITQGYIDPEDWNGDPEMNMLGAKGTRTSESKVNAKYADQFKKFTPDEMERKLNALQTEIMELDPGPVDGEEYVKPKMTKAKQHKVEVLTQQLQVLLGLMGGSSPDAGSPEKKRKQVVVEAMEEKPKKKAKKLTKKELEESKEDVKPAKSTTKKTKKELAESDEDEKPVKSTAKKTKKEVAESKEDMKPVKSTAKKLYPKSKIKEEISDDASDGHWSRGDDVDVSDGHWSRSDDDEENVKPAKKSQPKLGVKKGAKKGQVKRMDDDSADSEAEVMPKKKVRGQAAKVKQDTKTSKGGGNERDPAENSTEVSKSVKQAARGKNGAAKTEEDESTPMDDVPEHQPLAEIQEVTNAKPTKKLAARGGKQSTKDTVADEAAPATKGKAKGKKSRGKAIDGENVPIGDPAADGLDDGAEDAETEEPEQVKPVKVAKAKAKPKAKSKASAK